MQKTFNFVKFRLELSVPFLLHFPVTITEDVEQEEKRGDWKEIVENEKTSIENEKEIGSATSIVWSPKYSKYIGFLIANKNVEQDLNDHSILDNVKFELSEINEYRKD